MTDAERPICGDPDHRHYGPCGLYSSSPLRVHESALTLVAEVERLRGVLGLAKFPENHLIWPDDHFAPNMWVAVPKPRFEALRAALAQLEEKR